MSSLKWVGGGQDYAALKQNMERAQRQLHKLMRKYPLPPPLLRT